jgi:hypothetical protein
MFGHVTVKMGRRFYGHSAYLWACQLYYLLVVNCLLLLHDVGRGHGIVARTDTRCSIICIHIFRSRLLVPFATRELSCVVGELNGRCRTLPRCRIQEALPPGFFFLIIITSSYLLTQLTSKTGSCSPSTHSYIRYDLHHSAP